MYSSYGGTATSQTDLPWDLTDLGTYDVQVTFRGWCSIASQAFALGAVSIPKILTLHTTYYQTPIIIGAHGNVIVCAYGATACTSGTPLCLSQSNVVGFQFDAPACPAIAKVGYLVYSSTCIVGLAFDASTQKVRECT